jgi:hypothetical protein
MSSLRVIKKQRITGNNWVGKVCSEIYTQVVILKSTSALVFWSNLKTLEQAHQWENQWIC